MIKTNSKYLFLIILITIFILSCWGDSSPTSDKTKNIKISGVVTDKNGAGIARATVQITGTNFSATDTTDSVGAFSFENIKSGGYKVKAQKDSCIFNPINMAVTVIKTDIDTLKFKSADNYVHGYVLDIMNNKGIEGVTVYLSKSDTGYSSSDEISTKTGSNGEYVFYDIKKSRYRVLCRPIYDTFRNYSRDYIIESQAFNNREIVAHNFYFSSEKLQITRAEFSEETKTLYLEWTPSKSEYVFVYEVHASNLPDGFSKIESDFCFSWGDNKISVKVTPQNVMGLFDKDVISGVVYLSVSAVYNKDKDYFSFESLSSDAVAVRLSW